MVHRTDKTYSRLVLSLKVVANSQSQKGLRAGWDFAFYLVFRVLTIRGEMPVCERVSPETQQGRDRATR